MAQVSELDLVDISWPINLLTCSRRVDMMMPGERLAVSLKNTDTIDSLVALLKTMPDIDYHVRKDAACFLLTIEKHPGS